MLSNSAFVAGLKPGEKYTVADIAEITDIPKPTVYARVKKLVSARYLKESGTRPVDDGRPAKTYVLDIASGAGWTTRLEDSKMLSRLLKNWQGVNAVKSQQSDAFRYSYGWALYLTRYMYAISESPSSRKIDEAKADLISSVRKELSALRDAIHLYTVIENSIEVNDPLASGFLDTVLDIKESLARSDTSFEEFAGEMELLFGGQRPNKTDD